jgi:hypothetical protein
MPRQVDGQWISDDGRWRWDGRAWQPAQTAAAQLGGPPSRKPSPWLRAVLYLVGFVIVIGASGAIGWLVAIGGVVLVAVACMRSSLRSWAGWKWLPGLSSPKSAIAFALVLALYTVVAPTTIWGIALAGSNSSGAHVSSTVSPTPSNGSLALRSPTPTATPSATPTATPTPAPPASTPPPAAPAPPPLGPAGPPAPAAPAQPPAAPASCYPLSNSGTCYRPGQFCRDSDHGKTGRTADGQAIVCRNNNGWRWEPA